jgi:hypothetical protein
MTLDLPKSITAYFHADQGDSEAVARCFTENAVVKDDGCTYTGLAAIKKWKAETTTKYTYTSTPFASGQEEGKTIVTSLVAGNFPGSPVNLRYFFGLEDNKIASLEIIP